LENPDQNKVPVEIAKFLKEQETLSFATTIDTIPYSCNCFYIYLESYDLLVFKSEEETKHIQDGLQNQKVAGTIYSTKGGISKIRGIQYTGLFGPVEESILTLAKTQYYRAFPFGTLVKAPFWGIELTYMKMTDNRFGIGNKLEWERTSDKSKS